MSRRARRQRVWMVVAPASGTPFGRSRPDREPTEDIIIQAHGFAALAALPLRRGRATGARCVYHPLPTAITLSQRANP